MSESIADIFKSLNNDINSHFKSKYDHIHSNSDREKMYLDYVNNFHSIESFAYYYNISKEYAEWIINQYKNA
jgi:hypothetical protein